MKVAAGSAVHEPIREVPEENLPGSGQGLESEEGGKGLAYLRIAWGRRRLLYRATVCGLLASALIAYLIPKRYESTARLMPPDNNSSSGLAMAATVMSGGTAGLGGIASELLGLKSSSDVFVGILNSRTVQDKLIQEFGLQKVYWDSRMEDARRDLAAHTGTSVDRKSQIISITVSDKSPQRAAAMAQAYVEELNRLVSELSTSSARRERIFLEGRLQTADLDLKAAEKDFSEFASKNVTIDVKEQGKAMVEAAATLQGQLISAQSMYQGLREIYTDNNPRVRTLKARIDELQNQLDKLGGKGEGSSELTNTSAASFYPSIRKLPLLGVTYADLYRKTRIQEAVLEVLTKEYEMAKVQEAKEIPVVKILDSAHVPDKKSFPPRLLIMFLGTLCSFVVATIWVLARNEWDQTDPHDARKTFARKILADLKAEMPWFGRNAAGDGKATGLSPWRRAPSDKERMQ